MSGPDKASLRRRLELLFGLVLVAVMGSYASYTAIEQSEFVREDLRRHALAYARISAASLLAELPRESLAAPSPHLLEHLDALARAPDFRRIEILAGDGRLLLGREAPGITPAQAREAPPAQREADTRVGNGTVSAWLPLDAVAPQAWLRLEFGTGRASEVARHIAGDSLLVGLLLLVGALFAAGFVLRRPLRALARASDFATHLGSDWQHPLRLGDSSIELRQLEEALNHAAERIADSREELAASERRHRRMLEQLDELVFEADGQLRATYLNPAWERFTGQPLAQLPGRPLGALLAADDAEAMQQRLLAQASESADSPLELQLRRGDGSAAWLSLRLRAHRHEDGKRGFSGSALDVSHGKEVELGLRAAKQLAEDASRTKSAFLANMSHELCTPMNAIIGMTDLVLESELTGEQRSFLGHARAAADNLLAIINDVLDFSKIEAGRLDFEQIPFGLRDCVEHAVNAYRDAARAKGLALDFRIDATTPDALEGDPHRLRQVLQNLLSNGIKFTESGHVTLRVAVEHNSPREALLRFSVEDTGIGIAADQQQRIFEAFTQIDASATRRYGGTGLGLSVAARLVERMGGRIEVTSAPGKGSTFSFCASFKRSAEASGTRLETPLDGLRVLLAGESEFEIGHLAEALIGWQLRPEVETLGMRVLARLRHAAASRCGYHVLVLGERLGDMDAFELARRLRADAALDGCAIALAASSGQRGDAAQCRSVGIDAYLTRPIPPADLLDALLMALDSRGSGALITRHSLREHRRCLQILVAAPAPVGPRVAGLLERLGHAVHLVADGRGAIESCHAARFDLALLHGALEAPDAVAALLRMRAIDATQQRHTPVIALPVSAGPTSEETLREAGADALLNEPVVAATLAAALHRLSRGTLIATAVPAPAAADEGAAAVVFDAARALEYLDHDEALLRQLIEVYLDSDMALRMRLREALAMGDARAAHAAVHAIRGSVASFMAEAALRAAAQVESGCREGAGVDPGPALRVLWAEMDRLVEALRAYLDSAAATRPG